MRVTDGMITNNTLMYMNTNKATLSTLQQQLATGKKIQKPSEDPIVALRALTFQSSISSNEQYIRNINDGISWMDVTEQSLMNMTDILNKARELCVQASSDTLDTNERLAIIMEMNELLEQFVQEGNVSYAGRHVFTGFKTDLPLTFTQDNDTLYEITQRFTSDDLKEISFVDTSVTPPTIESAHVIRLAYGDVGDMINSDLDGFTVTSMSSTDENAYKPAPGEVYYLEDTGELVFNDEDVKNGNIPDFEITYEKQGFSKNDLRPEHYFDCVVKPDPNDPETWTEYKAKDDEIRYQVGYNQDMKINTLGKDVIRPEMIREFQLLFDFANNIPNDGSDEQALMEDLLGDYFEDMIESIDGYLDGISKQMADIGSRMNRLDLTMNRLQNDNLNLKELQSKNEDADLAEVVVKFSTAQVVYNASLMASSSILQNSLLDFI